MFPIAICVPAEGFTALDVTRLLVGLAALLLAARVLGEIARKLGQPSVLGELTAGILLGPSLFGRVAPEVEAWVFPDAGPTVAVHAGVRLLAVVLFLLVAGLEVDFSRVLRQGRTTSVVALFGLLVPLAVGFGAAWTWPGWTGRSAGVEREIHAAFVAIVLSISALPVIARTLLDLRLYRSDFGMVVIGAAIFDDIVGWILFAVLLAVAAAGPDPGVLVYALLGSVLFAVGTLTVGRWLIHRSLPWVQAHTSWPSGVLVFAIVLALAAAALTEALGLHAIFGAFLAGVALGDSAHLRERTRTTIREFVSSFFAPLFFAGIGTSIDLSRDLDPALCATVLVLACGAKIAGAALGARVSGMAPRDAWATGFALNSRGSMALILGLTALQHGIVDQSLFVALAVMAFVTSTLSGPLIQRVLRRERPRRFAGLLRAKAFVERLAGTDRRAVIGELARVLAGAHGLDAPAVERAVWTREQAGTTAIGSGMAIPHARLAGLSRPRVALGLSPAGIDFAAPDGEPVRIVFLILTPAEQPDAQLALLADIGKTLRDPEVRARLVEVTSWTELLAALRADVDAR